MTYCIHGNEKIFLAMTKSLEIRTKLNDDGTITVTNLFDFAHAGVRETWPPGAPSRACITVGDSM